jgi:hypothetical protein
MRECGRGRSRLVSPGRTARVRHGRRPAGPPRAEARGWNCHKPRPGRAALARRDFTPTALRANAPGGTQRSVIPKERRDTLSGIVNLTRD